MLEGRDFTQKAQSLPFHWDWRLYLVAGATFEMTTFRLLA